MTLPRKRIEEITQHTFRNEALLELALTHSSCNGAEGDNQRMEFLGDAVLDLVVAEMLYKKFPKADEGALDRARASVVNGKSLALTAERVGLARHLKVGEAHRQHHPDPSHAMLEDALEAVIGAVFLDGDMDCARKCIIHLFGQQIAKIELSTGSENPKGRLQEWAQSQDVDLTPVYAEISANGPDHDRHYESSVSINGKELGRGKGSSKKAAEAAAAAVALRNLIK